MTASENGETSRDVMERAIRRLGVLEHLFLGMAAVGALVAGAMVAWLLQQAVGWPFRVTWLVTALLLFLVPGGLSWWRVRQEARRAARILDTDPHRDDG